MSSLSGQTLLLMLTLSDITKFIFRWYAMNLGLSLNFPLIAK